MMMVAFVAMMTVMKKTIKMTVFVPEAIPDVDALPETKWPSIWDYRASGGAALRCGRVGGCGWVAIRAARRRDLRRALRHSETDRLKDTKSSLNFITSYVRF